VQGAGLKEFTASALLDSSCGSRSRNRTGHSYLKTVADPEQVNLVRAMQYRSWMQATENEANRGVGYLGKLRTICC
jgi:hypothetical protein